MANPVSVPLLVTVSLLASPQVGGQPGQREAGGKDLELERNQQQAVAVLRSLAESSRRFQRPESRARVQARLADALWSIDEPLARKLFEEAFLATAEIKGDSNERPQVVMEKKQRLRQEIVSLASKHDPKLVDRLLSLLPEVEKQVEDPLRPSTERTQQLIASARTLLKENPERAASMVAQSMEGGVIDYTLFFLQDLRAKDPEQADRLFERAIRTVAQRTPPNLNELLLLGSYLFTERGRVTYTMIAGRPAINVAPGLFAAEGRNPALIKLYLEAASQMLLRYTSIVPQQLTDYETSLIYAAIRQLMPLYERYAPDLLLALASLMYQMAPHIPESVRAMTAHAAQPSIEDSVKAVLEQANQEVSTEKRDRIYLDASHAFYTQRKFDLARDIARKISDRKAEEVMLQVIDTAIWRERVRQGEVPPGVLPRNLDILQESIVVAELAKLWMEQKKTDEAKILLQGQISKVLADKTSREKSLHALVGLVGTLMHVDRAEAVQLVGAIVTRLKDVPEVEIARSHAAYDVQAGGRTLSVLITLGDEFMLERVIKQLAEEEFDAMLSWVQQIQPEEPRALLTIIACQTALERKAQTPKTQ